MASSVATTRRIALQALAGMAAVGVMPGVAMATPDAVTAELKKRFGDRPITAGPVRIDIPDIVENGQAAPIGIEADSPMTAAEHVAAIHLFAEKNPTPNVASFYFSPLNAKAAVGLRIRLAETQIVVAVAETSTGALWRAEKLVKVTVGGCGG